MSETFPRCFEVLPEHAGKRVDQFLAAQLTETSRARVQQLIAEHKVTVNGAHVKASTRLEPGEQVAVLAEVQPPPMRAQAEAIPLEIVFEDADLAVINKPAGMMVHAGAGATEAGRTRGTLVNALLHHFGELSDVGGEMRPGIVHRLDKDTSGLIVIAKHDEIHRRLAHKFARREMKKTYLALVHGWVKLDQGTIKQSISRDRIRRTRMTTRGSGGREAITHYLVERRIDSAPGKFTLLKLTIDTGRTHQIRVHMASLGHPVVGDTLYGAAGSIRGMSLGRNFLHAAELGFDHPRTGERLSFTSPLPQELQSFLHRLERQP